MNGTLTTQERRVMGMVGVVGFVLKTLAIQTTTLVIAPTVFCAGATGTAAPLAYALPTVPSTAPRT